VFAKEHSIPLRATNYKDCGYLASRLDPEHRELARVGGEVGRGRILRDIHVRARELLSLVIGGDHVCRCIARNFDQTHAA
jgi:hypothetical protein